MGGPGGEWRGETIDAALRRVTAVLAPVLPDAGREAIALACATLGLSRTQLLVRGDEALEPTRIHELVARAERRAAGEPLAYLAGRREFWSLEFEVGPAVLVPRPETEMLVARALELGDELARGGREPDVIDLGTGSGAIAVAIARERPRWQVTAVDASPDALAVCARNARRHAVDRIELCRGDWLAAVPGRVFDLVVSNPPYLADSDPALRGDGLRFEPRTALAAGPDALSALRRIATTSPDQLRPGGALLLEHGADQAASVAAILVARGFRHVVSRRDLAGHARITEGRWP
jgi:release factor glutamine methyltransferase